MATVKAEADALQKITKSTMKTIRPGTLPGSLKNIGSDIAGTADNGLKMAGKAGAEIIKELKVESKEQTIRVKPHRHPSFLELGEGELEESVEGELDSDSFLETDAIPKAKGMKVENKNIQNVHKINAE